MKRWDVFFTLVVLLLFAGCDMKQTFTREGQYLQAAKKAYQNNNLDGAVFNLVESLRSDPKYTDAILLLLDAYPEACSRHLEEASRLKLSAHGDGWLEVLREYDVINRLQNGIEQLPSLVDPDNGSQVKFDPVNVDQYVDEANDRYAADWFQEASDIAARNPGNKLKLREAALAYKKADSIVPGYREAMKHYEALRARAMRGVGILTDQKKSEGRELSLILADQTARILNSDEGFLEFHQLVDRSEFMRKNEEWLLTLAGITEGSTVDRPLNLVGMELALVIHVRVSSNTTRDSLSEETPVNYQKISTINYLSNIVIVETNLRIVSNVVTNLATNWVTNWIDGTNRKSRTNSIQETRKSVNTNSLSNENRNRFIQTNGMVIKPVLVNNIHWNVDTVSEMKTVTLPVMQTNYIQIRGVIRQWTDQNEITLTVNCRVVDLSTGEIVGIFDVNRRNEDQLKYLTYEGDPVYLTDYPRNDLGRKRNLRTLESLLQSLIPVVGDALGNQAKDVFYRH